MIVIVVRMYYNTKTSSPQHFLFSIERFDAGKDWQIKPQLLLCSMIRNFELRSAETWLISKNIWYPGKRDF